MDIGLEDTLNNGCIDIAVLHEGQVYLIKFNVVEFAPERRALQQIKDKGYADKYRARGESTYLIGKEFSKTSRNILGFEVATLLFKKLLRKLEHRLEVFLTLIGLNATN